MISMGRETPIRDEHPDILRLIGLVLAAVTLAVFIRSAAFSFVTLDDAGYIYDNPHDKRGLTLDGIAWAFTNSQFPLWHPLTWLSFMTDVTLFGVDATAEHVVNILFHIGGAIFLFLSLERITGRRWRSALVTALFALHPLRVESVVWIAERKDVL